MAAASGGATGIPGAAQPLSVGIIAARLERLPMTGLKVWSRLLLGTATFFDAYAVLAIAYALPVLVRDWHLAPAAIGYIISSSFAGQFIGALFFGWLAEKKGRLYTANLTILVFALMSIACIFAWDATSLAALRFLQGIGLGGEVPVAGAYINEVVGARGRGRFFVLYEMAFSLGLLGASAVGYWLVPIYGWQVMFVIGALPAVVVILPLRWLPESPRWLASKGRLREADETVQRMERSVERSGRVLPPVAAVPAATSSAPVAPWRELFHGIYRRRTLVVWTFWVCSYVITYGLTSWLPTIYSSVFHLPISQAIGYALITNAVAFCGGILCAFLIDAFGRRNWYMLAFFGGFIPLVVLWYLGASTAVEVLVFATWAYFFIGTVNLSLYLYTAELYPTRIRAFGTSVASAWLRLGSIISPTLVGFLIANYGVNSVFGFFAICALIGGLVCSAFAIESAGEVLEELSP